MTNDLTVQLSWEDPASGERREPRLNLPIALGREFTGMPAEHDGKRVARMLLSSNRVSRYHALIDLQDGHLVVTDQNSSHGTLVNGKPQRRCILANGDILQIGPHMISVIFDLSGANLTIPPLPAISHHLSLTDIFPVTSKKLNLHQNGFIIPGIVTVFFVVAMLVTRKINELFFLYTLAAYLVSASHYLIHKLCHKHKPWWLLLSLGLATGLPLLGGFHISIPKTGNHIFDLTVEAFLEKGFAEELFKALPVLLLYLLGTILSSPKRELIGIWEPMDGILLSTASATGFALIETMIHVHEEIGTDGSFAGLTLLIPQILGDISGQVAYSGYFGYFIGFSAFKPSKRWQLLGIGYLTSSVIHGVWAVVDIFQKKQQHNLFSSICLAAIGSIAYAFLMAAILKARQFSSNHAQKTPKAVHQI